jgi:hypothetical protein
MLRFLGGLENKSSNYTFGIDLQELKALFYGIE